MFKLQGGQSQDFDCVSLFTICMQSCLKWPVSTYPAHSALKCCEARLVKVTQDTMCISVLEGRAITLLLASESRRLHTGWERTHRHTIE